MVVFVVWTVICSGGISFAQQGEGERRVYTNAEVFLLSRPSVGGAPIRPLPINSPLLILEETIDWLVVETADKEEGWVQTSSVSPTQTVVEEAAVEAVLVYAQSSIGLYSAPSVDSEKQAELPVNTQMTVLEMTASWLGVETTEGRQGWVIAEKVGQTRVDVPVAPEKPAQLTVETEEPGEVAGNTELETVEGSSPDEVTKSVVLPELEEHSAAAVEDAQRSAAILALEKEIQPLPESIAYANMEIYRRLLDLDPANPLYRAAHTFYALESKKTVTFRQSRWGMSVEEVMEGETAYLVDREPGKLTYSTSLGGKDVMLHYLFVDGKLARAKYFVTESHSNKNMYIQRYDEFKELLVAKYGEPAVNKILWTQDEFKDNYHRWGHAISIGHLAYFSSWEVGSTRIINFLKGDNSTINCGIEYSSVYLRAKEKEAAEQEALEAL